MIPSTLKGMVRWLPVALVLLFAIAIALEVTGWHIPIRLWIDSHGWFKICFLLGAWTIFALLMIVAWIHEWRLERRQVEGWQKIAHLKDDSSVYLLLAAFAASFASVPLAFVVWLVGKAVFAFGEAALLQMEELHYEDEDDGDEASNGEETETATS